jgi:DNA-binding response OmpR family regulator
LLPFWTDASDGDIGVTDRPSQPPLTPGCPILIVEDDEDLREMMAHFFECAGFDAQVAVNGEDALAKAHARPPHVIVLDLMMPVMDGWTFRARQRDDAAIADIPVVVLSAVPTDRLRQFSAASVFQKPCDLEALLSAVRAHC